MGVVALHPAPSLQKAVSQTFRANQVTAGDAAAKAIARIWNAGFSIKEARASWARMRPSVMAIISRYYAASQAGGQVYYNACRLTAGYGPLAKTVRVPPVVLTEGHIGNVIDPCGLGAFLHEVKGGARMMDAYATGRDTLTSAASALVMDGARDWLQAASAADPKSNGIRRVTGGTCDYCENLASQGAQAADAGWHNDCECTSEPAFGDDNGPSPSLDTTSVTEAPAADADDIADEAADVTPEAPEAVAPGLAPSDIGPLGSVPFKLSGNSDADQAVMKALATIPNEVQSKVIDDKYIKSVSVDPNAKLGKKVIGLYDSARQSLQIKPVEDAGDTALHEAMHAVDLRLGASSKPGFQFIANSLVRKFAGSQMSHYDPAVEGRDVANKEMFAELAMQYLQGKPLTLGKKAMLGADDAAKIDKFFQSIGLGHNS